MMEPVMDAEVPFVHLRLPAASDAALSLFDASLAAWFRQAFESPTLIQRLAWPSVLRGDHLLIASPTGTGKSLASFLPIFDALCRDSSPGMRCLYLAPLKALCRDMRANLRGYLARLGRAEVRIDARTGDTAHSVRARQFQEPPHVLLTTPESFAVLLSQMAWHERLRDVRYVILDEIHTLPGSKRGADLALSLERLDALTGGCQRIGLSATCAPLEMAARFLVGEGRRCSIAHVPEVPRMDVELEMLAECGELRTWHQALAQRLQREIAAQATTLVFANTRHLAERIAWNLKRLLGEDANSVAVHHSSLAAARRRLIERQLKQGKLRAVISSASLELGIDIGFVEGVVFVHPPGGVSRFLQRLGRSGHRPGQTRRGLMILQSPAELLEGVVTLGSGKLGQLESLEMIQAPLDVLCQHLAGMAMTCHCHPDEVYAAVRRAAPYRDLSRGDFEKCLRYLYGQKTDGEAWLPARLCRHGESFAIANEAVARLLRRNLGAIVSEPLHEVRLDQGEDKKPIFLGELDEVFVQQLHPGDRFVLEGRSLECRRKQHDGVLVTESQGKPSIPRWLGGGWAWSAELARRVFLWRAEAAEQLRGDGCIDIAPEIIEFVSLQETHSEVPRETSVLIEAVDRGFGIEYAVHTPLPRPANEALASIVSARLKAQGRSVHLPLAVNLGMLLFVEGMRELAAEDWHQLFSTEEWQTDADRVLRESPLVRIQFNRVAQTGLMVLRHPQGGRRKVGGRNWAGRELFDQVAAADPHFVLLEQSRREVCVESLDFARALAWLNEVRALPLVVRWLAQPSPFVESWLTSSTTRAAMVP
jgi:ATP-dependent Lhr-like helicase